MYKDHKENEFRTKEEMYKHWNTSHSAVNHRMAKGMSLGEALEAKPMSLSDRGRAGRKASGWEK
jgi:hypothetical protein